jgi:predicted  nucleic acid-binding Zn-ribbon protein
MKNQICTACGTQFPMDSVRLELCPICVDDRQYVPEKGQGWTTLDELSNN